ncbi:MAG: endoribonuclease MazF [Geminicoccaceae bacterium]
MVRRGAAPERGDVVWLSFSPQAGREQAGRRPALVLSPAEFNRRAGLAMVCPVTSRIKGYPFEVPLRAAAEVSGVVLVDQLRSLDWRARRAEPAGKAPAAVMTEVLAKLRSLLGD